MNELQNLPPAVEPKTPEAASPDTVTEVIRGFEIVCWNAWGRTWDRVGVFRNTELAMRQMMTDVKWLQERHPKQLYRIFALVSHAPPKQIEGEQSTPTNEISPPSETAVTGTNEEVQAIEA